MEVTHLEQIFGALQSADVRYLLVGGLAVIAHGYVRTTKDVDLVIALEPDNVRRAMTALDALGFRPKVPVSAEEFADPAKRKKWIQEKQMMLFQLVSDRFRFEPIDIFVAEPFDFGREYGRCVWKQLNPELRIPVIAAAPLVAMKKAAGRPQDLADIAELETQKPNET
jgi:hypothetical protein